jgi:putative endonuclease
MPTYFVYLLSSDTRTLYIGVTNNLDRRVREHKLRLADGFTKRYDIDRLVYYETFENIEAAIAREKQLKGWRRSKKVDLVTTSNPLWKDLATDWIPDTPT